MFQDLIYKNRSYRRFKPDPKPSAELLKELIQLARLCPSASNQQPLRYVLSSTQNGNGLIFPHLRWAALLTDWTGPSEHERPTAYIVIVADKKNSPNLNCDLGIAAQTILLGAVHFGFGGCMIANINKSALRDSLQLEDSLEILLVIALGTPSEDIVIEEAHLGDPLAYWRDSQSVHHVPKLTIQDLIHREI